MCIIFELHHDACIPGRYTLFSSTLRRITIHRYTHHYINMYTYMHIHIFLHIYMCIYIVHIHTRHMYLGGTHFCQTRASSGVLLCIQTYITTHSYVDAYIFDICMFFWVCIPGRYSVLYNKSVLQSIAINTHINKYTRISTNIYMCF